MSSKKELGFEGYVNFEKVIDYLEQLVISLKFGKIVVEKDGEFLVLEPARVVKIEVEAEQKKDGEKFSLELEWGRSRVSVKKPGLRITSSKPAPAGKEQGKAVMIEAGKDEAFKENADGPGDEKPSRQLPGTVKPAKKPAAKKPAAKKPAAKKPAAKKPAAKKPAAKKPAAKKPAAK